MQQIKALLLKEFHSHKTTFLLPAFIAGGILVIVLILLIIAQIHSNFVSTYTAAFVSLDNIDEGYLQKGFFGAFMVWVVSFFNMLIPWILLIICYCGMMTGSLNDDWRYKCAIFHHSFPVSRLKATLTKFAFVLLSAFAMFLAITLVINLILICYALFALSGNSMLYYNFIGYVQSFTLYFLSLFVIIGTASFFATVFNSKTSMKTLLSVVVLALPFGLLLGMKKLGVFIGWLKNIYLPHFNFKIFLPNSEPVEPRDVPVQEYLNEVISTSWSNIFSTNTLLQIGVGLMFFALATVIILKRRIA